VSLPRWLSNPYLGLLGIIASMAGFVFAIYSYYSIKEYRELTYAIAPERVVLIDSRKASDFEIKYKGNKIESDVTSAIVTIWNQGKKSIRPQDILKEVVVVVGKSTPILEAKPLRISRDVTGFWLDNARLNEGIVMPKWQILEHKDGAVIQIIYVGSPAVPIVMTATIEGRRDIVEYSLKQPFSWMTPWVFGILIGLTVLRLYAYYIGLSQMRFSYKLELLTWVSILALYVEALGVRLAN
jgi:hypothetical protein